MKVKEHVKEKVEYIKTYTLTLTEKEAKHIMRVCGSVGGLHPTRTVASNLYNQLEKVGVDFNDLPPCSMKSMYINKPN